MRKAEEVQFSSGKLKFVCNELIDVAILEARRVTISVNLEIWKNWKSRNVCCEEERKKGSLEEGIKDRKEGKNNEKKDSWIKGSRKEERK